MHSLTFLSTILEDARDFFGNCVHLEGGKANKLEKLEWGLNECK